MLSGMSNLVWCLHESVLFVSEKAIVVSPNFCERCTVPAGKNRRNMSGSKIVGSALCEPSDFRVSGCLACDSFAI